MHKNSAWLINDVLQQSKRQCSSVECVINETSVEPNGLTQKLQVTLATPNLVTNAMHVFD